jgi:sirohydrochlorin cobaltochelatase
MIDTAPVYVWGASVKTAVIILFHGSRAEGSDAIVHRITTEVRRRGKFTLVKEAFLQHAKPDIRESIAFCSEQRVNKIVVVPFFLQLGTHVTGHIPVLVEKIRAGYPNIEIVVTDAVGSHPLLINVVLDLAEKVK